MYVSMVRSQVLRLPSCPETNAFLESANKEKSDEQSEIQIIDIAKVRKLGILPIAFQNKEAFVGYDFRSSTDEVSAANSDEPEADAKSDDADSEEKSDDDEEDDDEK